MERREFLKLSLGFAIGAAATAAALIPAAEAAPLMVPPTSLEREPDHAVATEQDLAEATPQQAQFYIRRRRRPRRRVYFVRRRPRRRRRIYFY
jgi:hypothetical protein